MSVTKMGSKTQAEPGFLKIKTGILLFIGKKTHCSSTLKCFNGLDIKFKTS